MCAIGAVNVAHDVKKKKLTLKEIAWELLSLLALAGTIFTMSSYVSEKEFEREGIALCIETETKTEHTQGGFWFSLLLEAGELKCTHKTFSFVITENERSIAVTFALNESKKDLWLPLLFQTEETYLKKLDQLGLVAVDKIKKCVDLLMTKYSPGVTSVEFWTWPGDVSFLPARSWPDNWIYLGEEVKQACDISQFGFTWERFNVERKGR